LPLLFNAEFALLEARAKAELPLELARRRRELLTTGHYYIWNIAVLFLLLRRFS